MRKLKACFLFLIFSLMIYCFFPSIGIGSSLAGLVEKGNRLFNQRKFDEALKRYTEAQTKSPDSAVINFNKGTALYKKGDYEKAAFSFSKALNTEETALEAKANYNLGNSRYKQAALKEGKDLSAAVDLCKEALNYYARAIDLDERDKDIKYNYEFVEKKLQELLKKQKQQQKKDEQQQKEEQQQEKQAGQQQKSQPQEEKQPQTSGQKEERKEEPQGDLEKQPQEEQSGEEESSAQEKEGTERDKEQPGVKEEQRQMSKEEARMLLESYRQEELQGELKDKEPVKAYPDVLKDW